jgi:thiol-disulfide isomerase/thioredoxin
VTSGLIVCAVALAVAAAVGLLWRRNNGKMRDPRPPRPRTVRPGQGGTAPAATAGSPPATAAGSAAGSWPAAAARPLATAEDGAGTWLPGAPDADQSAPASAGRAVTVAELGQPLGTRATLLQFSSAFCAPCRATRRVLTDVAGMTDGVAHVEIDAESRLDLVRRLDVRRTPTVFVLGPDGRIVKRASGQPRKADVIAALGAVT